MDKRQKVINVTGEDETFLLGRLEDEKYSGAFLTPEYLIRLSEVLAAAETRTNFAEAPDAIKNLFGILDRLLRTHQEQIRSEFQLSNVDEFNKVAEEIRRALDDGNGDDDGPKRA